MLKTLNTILFVACENSDGLMGFYYSHDGFWHVEFFGDSRLHSSHMTKMECANACMGKEGCVAISTYAAASNGQCWHYFHRGDLIRSREEFDVSSKAYIKCFCKDV